MANKLSPQDWKRILTVLGGAVLTVLPSIFPQYAWLGDALGKVSFLLFGIAVPSPGQSVVATQSASPPADR
jgi:hypothetical protein